MSELPTIKRVTMYLMGVFYIFAGLNHFINPEFYTNIMPGYMPWHLALVILSGIAEIIFGFLLFIPQTRTLAAWLIIALLIAVFPANINTALNPEQFNFAPPIGHYLRLPFQAVFILWAFWYTRPDTTAEESAANPADAA
jgi:uncharacterized membrane protein